MDTEARDGATVRIPPPLVYLLAVVLGLLLHAFVVRLPIVLSPSVRIALTALAGLAGVALMAGAIGLFRRTGQDPKPWKDTPEIISTGVFRFTRNPMYVAMALFQASIGVGAANGWILALIPPVIVIVYATAVRHEEAYLEGKFGDAYRGYRSTVRRWL